MARAGAGGAVEGRCERVGKKKGKTKKSGKKKTAFGRKQPSSVTIQPGALIILNR